MNRAPGFTKKQRRGLAKQAKDKVNYKWSCNGAYYWNVCTRYAVLAEIPTVPEITQEIQEIEPDTIIEQPTLITAATRQPEPQINSAVGVEQGVLLAQSSIIIQNAITDATIIDTNSGTANDPKVPDSTNNEGLVTADHKVNDATNNLTMLCTCSSSTTLN
jgi:hypothetical protein